MSPKNQVSTKDKVKIVLLTLLIVTIIGIGSILGGTIAILKELPEYNFAEVDQAIEQTSIIYDNQNNFIENVNSIEYEKNIPIEEVPEHVINAFLSVEDRSFYSHKGIDVRNILASLRTNMESGELTRGGSTITQQLIKNVYLSSEKTFSRKLQEIYLALEMESELPKEKILEAYLNRVDLGLGVHGIEAAANAYFSKSADELTLGEGALLAGIVKAPSNYQPIMRIPVSDYNGPEKLIINSLNIGDQEMYLIENPEAKDRQKIVLHSMVQNKKLGKIEEEEFGNASIKFNPYIPKELPYSTYVADFIQEEAIREIAVSQDISEEEAAKLVNTGGLQIYSTIDPEIQANLEAFYRNFGKNVLEQGNGKNFLDLTLDDSQNILDAQGNIIFYNIANLYDDELNFILPLSLVKKDDNGDIVLPGEYFQGNNNVVKLKDACAFNEDGQLITYSMGYLDVASSAFDYDGKTLRIHKSTLEEYDNILSEDQGNIRLSSKYYAHSLQGTKQPQSASLILDNQSGNICALIGGLDVDNPSRKLYNRVNSLRQPGSALTPFSVYLPALEHGKTLGSVYDDIPRKFDGMIWPQKGRDDYIGYTILKDGLKSQNDNVSVAILEEIGFESALNTLSRFGYFKANHMDQDYIISQGENDQRNDYSYDALALGNLVGGVPLTSLAESYGSVVAMGLSPKAHVIREIKDSNGHILFSNENLEPQKNLSIDNAYLLRSTLQETDFANRISGKDTQTYGLASRNKFHSDFHLIGGTNDFTLALWVGADSQKLSLSTEKETFYPFFQDILTSLPNESSFPNKPTNIVEKEISTKTGLLANNAARYSKTAETVPFIQGTEPKEETEGYTSAQICTVSNRLATQYCPSNTVTYRYYFQRPDKYDPEEFDGIIPKDYYGPPKSYCNVHTAEWYQQQQELQRQLELQKQMQELLQQQNQNKQNRNRNQTNQKQQTQKQKQNTTRKKKN